MAEREGFEPPIGLHLCRISSAVLSTTQPPLRVAGRGFGPPAFCGWRGNNMGAGPRQAGKGQRLAALGRDLVLLGGPRLRLVRLFRKSARRCPYGGTGRRVRLKIGFRKECWFDSG